MKRQLELLSQLDLWLNDKVSPRELNKADFDFTVTIKCLWNDESSSFINSSLSIRCIFISIKQKVSLWSFLNSLHWSHPSLKKADIGQPGLRIENKHHLSGLHISAELILLNLSLASSTHVVIKPIVTEDQGENVSFKWNIFSEAIFNGTSSISIAEHPYTFSVKGRFVSNYGLIYSSFNCIRIKKSMLFK